MYFEVKHSTSCCGHHGEKSSYCCTKCRRYFHHDCDLASRGLDICDLCLVIEVKLAHIFNFCFTTIEKYGVKPVIETVLGTVNQTSDSIAKRLCDIQDIFPHDHYMYIGFQKFQGVGTNGDETRLKAQFYQDQIGIFSIFL